MDREAAARLNARAVEGNELEGLGECWCILRTAHDEPQAVPAGGLLGQDRARGVCDAL